MKSYLIGYDLNRPGQNYENLFAAIKAQSNGSWWHHLDSTWIIKSDSTSEAIRDALTPHIDANDELLVVLLVREAAWFGFNGTGSEWLSNNL
jgi:hypothetical protein